LAVEGLHFARSSSMKASTCSLEIATTDVGIPFSTRESAEELNAVAIPPDGPGVEIRGSQVPAEERDESPQVPYTLAVMICGASIPDLHRRRWRDHSLCIRCATALEGVSAGR
jgi:hypothetical protein